MLENTLDRVFSRDKSSNNKIENELLYTAVFDRRTTMCLWPRYGHSKLLIIYEEIFLFSNVVAVNPAK